jgi:HAE1 family hydrophobic/amphiphilic exporter-1
VVRLTAQDASQLTRVNGHPGVLLRIGQQNGTNTTDVADAVVAALPGLRASLPAGAELIVVQDASQFVRTSIGGVRSELITAVLLTSIVLFLFLHSPRIAFIVLLSIPTTLLGALIAMSFMGFSLNFLSMLGLTLSIGILVDDSIVVLESILRRLEGGDEPTEAAINGRAQIGLAALAITLVDVVIFAPVGLVRGQVGGFFREFGFTIAATTLISLGVSFTLTPLLSAKLMRLKHGTGWITRFGNAWDRGFARLERGYERVLRWSLHHRLPTLALASLSLVFGVWLLASGRVGTEFFPQNDQGFVTISTQAPPGTTLAAHDAAMRQVEQRLMQVPEVKNITA